MPSLPDLQAAFLSDLYRGTRESAAYLAAGRAGDPKRLQIYAHNLFLNLRDHLLAVYPVVAAVVGKDFFQRLARDAVLAQPQTHGNRHEYGGHLARFLTAYEPVKPLPYLPALARLEWAVFRANLAEDALALDSAALQTLIAEGEVPQLALHPSVSVLHLPCNALAIWEAHRGPELPDAIPLRMEPEIVLIWRDPRDDVLLKRVTPDSAKFLEACRDGVSLSEALIAATGGDPAAITALQPGFADLLGGGVLTHRAGRPHRN